MKAIEFSSKLKGNKIEIPEKIGKQLQKNQPFRVILLVEEQEEMLWDKMVSEQFLEGYADSDSI